LGDESNYDSSPIVLSTIRKVPKNRSIGHHSAVSTKAPTVKMTPTENSIFLIFFTSFWVEN